MKKIKVLCSIGFAAMIGFSASAQLLPQAAETETSLVKWMSFEEAFKKSKDTSKPLIIDVYTDWCGWCKHMMKTTYSSPTIAQFINENFYPVKFDAETQDTIEYMGVKYFNPRKDKRSTHQLAIKLLNSSLSYPTTIFLSRDKKFNMLAAGFLEENKIAPMLVYMNENVYQMAAYDDFKASFEEMAHLKDTIPVVYHGLKTVEAFLLDKKKKEKLLLNLTFQGCNSCNVTRTAVLSNAEVSDKIKASYRYSEVTFSLVDSLSLLEKKYSGNDSISSQIRRIREVCKANFNAPKMLVIDKDIHAIGALPYYASPAVFAVLLKYYEDGDYLKYKWDDYFKAKGKF